MDVNATSIVDLTLCTRRSRTFELDWTLNPLSGRSRTLSLRHCTRTFLSGLSAVLWLQLRLLSSAPPPV